MTAYGAALARVGLTPDNPDGMYTALASYIRDPVAFKNADKCWPGARDDKIWWPDGNVVALQWPFGGGKWLDNVPKTDEQIRAVYKIPVGVATRDFLFHLYKVTGSLTAYRIDSHDHKCDGGGGFLGIHVDVDLSHVFSDVTHAVSAVTHINVSPPNFKWLENAVNAAGREIGTVANAITTEAGKIGDEIKKIPIAGPLFVSTIDLMASPLAVGLDIAQGKDIAQSLITHLQADIKDVKEVAPYAQMVISFIPGIGPVVSGAIGMGLALAEGQPIDQILIAGVKGAIPGGPIAAAAFSAAVGAVQAIASNEPLAEGIMRTALDALPLPEGAAGDACRTALKSAIKLTGAVASGQRVDTALLSAASQNLESLKDIPGISPTVAASLKISCGAGLAIATGAVAQTQLRKSSTAPTALDKLQATGHAVALKDPVILAAEKPFPNGIRGFEIGIGLMQYQVGIASFTAIRAGLKDEDQKAFDTATSLHIGRVIAPPAPSLTPEARAARGITFGLQGANKEPASLLSAAVLAVPGMRSGVEIAQSEIPSAHPAAWATGMGLLVMAVAACSGVGLLTTYALGAVTAGAVLIWKRE